MLTTRIWFNKTFSTISAVLNNLRQSLPSGEVTLIATHNHEAASVFLAADECYLEPADISGQDYLEWCLNFCREHQINVFWPGKEAALFSLHHADFQDIGVQVLSVADHATLTLLHNKAHFYSALPPEVALVMDFLAVTNSEAFDAAIAGLSTKHNKLCVKPAMSVYGLGFRILDTKRDSISQLLAGVEYQIPLSELRQGMVNTPVFNTLLVMEHLAGPEWSVDCAGRHGELLCAVQRKKSQLPGHGQSIDNNSDIQGMVTRLTAHYRLNGIFNIQFKEGENGVRLLEINPRPSGGFGMACLSGANIAQIAWQGFKGEAISEVNLHYGLRVAEVGTPVVLKQG